MGLCQNHALFGLLPFPVLSPPSPYSSPLGHVSPSLRRSSSRKPNPRPGSLEDTGPNIKAVPLPWVLGPDVVRARQSPELRDSHLQGDPEGNSWPALGSVEVGVTAGEGRE